MISMSSGLLISGSRRPKCSAWTMRTNSQQLNESGPLPWTDHGRPIKAIAQCMMTSKGMEVWRRASERVRAAARYVITAPDRESAGRYR